MKRIVLWTVVVFGVMPVWAQQAASIFYKFDVVAHVGQSTPAGTLSGFGIGPSVSETGTVAFVGQLGSVGDGVFMGNGSSIPTYVTTGFANPSRTFDNSVQINRTNQILANDRFAGSPPTYFNRIWNGNNPGSFVLVAKGCGTCDFPAVLTNASMNNVNQSAFLAFDSSFNTLLATPNGSSFNTVILNGTPSPRPMVDDTGHVVVFDPTKKQISLYANNLGTEQDIADSGEFNTLGQSPGISRNGAVIGFYGDINSAGATHWGTTTGPGIFVSIDLGGGSRNIIRVVGDQSNAELGYDVTGNKITFLPTGFNPNARVGVTDLDLGAAGIASDSLVVDFFGTPSGASRDNPAYPGHPLFFSNQQGLWTVRVDVENQLESPLAIVFHPRGAIRVAQIGDVIGGLTISQISVFDPIANAGADPAGNLRTMRRGDHYVTFWAADAAGNQMILRGSHLDSDQDGLLDHWETDGIDMNGDGIPELNLKALGADPNRRDIFLEIDWLADQSDHLHTPISGVISSATNSSTAPFASNFAKAPALSGNMYGARLDGAKPAPIPAGIQVHIDGGPGTDDAGEPLSINMGSSSLRLQGGDQIGLIGAPASHVDVVYFGVPCPAHELYLPAAGTCSVAIAGLNTRAFSDIKDNFFGTNDKRAREFAFHYVVFADSYQTVLSNTGEPFTSFAAQPITNNSLTSATNLPRVPDGFVGDVLKITAGAGAGQIRGISLTNGNAITVFPDWAINPDTTSQFALLNGSSGLSEEDIFATPDFNSFAGNDLIVTMRGFGIIQKNNVPLLGNMCVQWRTLAHELGHNLGLRHCGTNPEAKVCQKSPSTYLSLMSYAHQLQCKPPDSIQTYSGATDPTYNDFANLNHTFFDVDYFMGNTFGLGSSGQSSLSSPNPEPNLTNYIQLNGPMDRFPPAVTVTSPPPLSVVPLGSTLTVSFNGTDNVAVASASASFDVAGNGQRRQIAATHVSGSTYQAVFSNISGPNGYRTVQAFATDTSTNVGSSFLPLQVGSGSPGSPNIAATLLGQGSAGTGKLYVDLQLKNTGVSDAKNVLIKQLVFTTVKGSGTVTYDTTLSPKLPISTGNLFISAATKIRLYFDVPSTVTSFSVVEKGTFQNAVNTTFNYQTTQTITP